MVKVFIRSERLNLKTRLLALPYGKNDDNVTAYLGDFNDNKTRVPIIDFI
jgi:hypothetical protein